MEFAIFAALVLFAVGLVNTFFAYYENNPEDRFNYLFTSYIVSLIGVLVSLSSTFDNESLSILSLGFNVSVVIFSSLNIYCFEKFDYFSNFAKQEAEVVKL